MTDTARVDPGANQGPLVVEVQLPQPSGVQLGSGGDPLILVLPTFAVGSLTLGVLLTGWVAPLSALTGIVPTTAAATGVALLIGTVWAIFLGQTIVAGISGIFAGFWLSLSALLLGLGHNWYVVPATAISDLEQLFFICWAVIIFVLLFPTLKLPVVYPLVMALVVLALVLSAIAAGGTDPVGIYRGAGIVVIVFAALGWYAFLAVGFTAMGFELHVPLGPVPADLRRHPGPGLDNTSPGNGVGAGPAATAT